MIRDLTHDFVDKLSELWTHNLLTSSSKNLLVISTRVFFTVCSKLHQLHKHQHFDKGKILLSLMLHGKFSAYGPVAVRVGTRFSACLDGGSVQNS